MKLGIILGSTRDSRVTDRLAKWALATAKDLPDTEVELLDLKDYPMPFYDEAGSPKYNPDRHPIPVVQKWLDKIADKDAYMIVTPEYNHNIPGVLKNALDFIGLEAARKPYAIISHGSTGGARATSSLKITISEQRGVAISSNVALTFRVAESFDESGVLNSELAAKENGPQAALDTSLAELKWYSDALATARAKN